MATQKTLILCSSPSKDQVFISMAVPQFSFFLARNRQWTVYIVTTGNRKISTHKSRQDQHTRSLSVERMFQVRYTHIYIRLTT